jgi:hypothetical protein
MSRRGDFFAFLGKPSYCLGHMPAKHQVVHSLNERNRLPLVGLRNKIHLHGNGAGFGGFTLFSSVFESLDSKTSSTEVPVKSVSLYR